MSYIDTLTNVINVKVVRDALGPLIHVSWSKGSVTLNRSVAADLARQLTKAAERAATPPPAPPPKETGLTDHTKDMIDRWARVLQYLAEEHGRPNSFALSEIRPGGCPAWVGYAFKSERYLNYLWERLGGRGWGSRPVYYKGRIYV